MMDFIACLQQLCLWLQQLQVPLETTHSLHICALVSQVTSIRLEALLQANLSHMERWTPTLSTTSVQSSSK